MSLVRMLRPVVLSCSLAACAIHPLPEDVTGVKTASIVHRIRCEAQGAVIQVAEELRSKPNFQTKLQKLESVGVVYAFSLSGTETDGLSTSATIVKPLNNGSWTYNPSLGDSLMRQNVRTFTVVDNFSVLLHKMDQKKCPAEPNGPNYQYPIVGKIGVAEMTRTFMTLVLHDDLSSEQGAQIAQGTALDLTASGPPTMVDTISFTTTLTAGVTPTLMLTPVTMAAQLTGATFGVNLSRADIHQVVVGLALPPPSALAPQPAGTTSSTQKQPLSAHTRFGLLISGSTRNTGEELALEAVNNQILRFQLPRPLIVTP